jgi:signal transduction histidine kinase
MENIVEKINQSAVNFLEPLDEERTYKSVLKEATKLFDASDGSIFLDVKGVLQRVYTSSPIFKKVQIRKNANTYTAYTKKKVMVAYKHETSKAHPILKRTNFQTYVFIPLCYKTRSVGVLTLYFLTKEKFTKKQLNTFNLFGTLASLAIEKTHLYNEVKKTLEIKDKFISLAAHELRTPLTTMSGYIQLLNRKMMNKGTLEEQWTKTLLEESKRLTNLIQELLEINRMRAGILDYYYMETDVLVIMRKALEKIIPMFPHHIFKIDSHADSIPIVGDEHKLVHAFTHLLENSGKFSPDGSKIHIKTKKAYKDTIIQIVDKGRGIEQEDIPYVFEGFYKGKENTTEGMGIGLFFVKNIIDNHRGEIQIHSEIGKGTIVEVRLPSIRK